MTDTPTPIVVPISGFDQQLKAQVRIGIAGLGGGLVLRHVLPAWAVNDQTIDYITGLVLLLIAAVWAWMRARLDHTRFWQLAIDPRVPDAVVTAGEPGTPPAN